MAITIYDPPGQNTPTLGTSPNAGGLLNDPNFLNLLAGIGSRLGGKDSVAEALGAPTIAYNNALAAQRAAAKVAATPQPAIRRYREITDRLGGDFTPPGTAGPRSLKVQKDGSYLVEGDLDLTPQTQPEDILQDTSLNPYRNVPRTRFSLGEAPTQEELESTLDYPFDRATTSPSANVVAIPSSATLTAQDLRGLSADQVDKVLGQAINASQLEAQVLGLAGRDITAQRTHQRLTAEANRREAATAATALVAAKHKAAETIAQSNLLPEQQEALFQRLDAATTLEQARGELVNAAKLPKRVTSAQERDDYSREQFNGRSYGQLTAPEQAVVNARILKEKATYNIHATDTGLYRINQKTGAVSQVHGPTAPSAVPAPSGAPSAGTARSGAISLEMGRKYLPGAQNLSDAQLADLLEKPENYQAVRSKMTPQERQAADTALKGATPVPPSGTAPSSAGQVLPYTELSPFAKELSAPNAAQVPFGAKPPTEGQAKAQGYGSRALQAHETVRDLESKAQFGDDYWLTQRNALRRALKEVSPVVAVPGATAAGTIAGGVAGGVIGFAGGLALGIPIPGAVLGTKLGAYGGAAVGGLAGIAGAAKLVDPVLATFDKPAERAYMQAKVDFMTAVLRKESGAAISAAEFENEDKRYFPQYGDTPQVREQKTRAREQAIRAIQGESGRKLLPPQVVPFQQTESPRSPGPVVPESPAAELRKSVTGYTPTQALPVPLQQQQSNTPSVAPRATMPTEYIARFQVLKALKSEDITRGIADPMLKEMGGELLNQQMSYFGPAQKAAIRTRIKKLGL